MMNGEDGTEIPDRSSLVCAIVWVAAQKGLAAPPPDSERVMRRCCIALIRKRFYNAIERILVSLTCWSSAESPKSLGGKT